MSVIALPDADWQIGQKDENPLSAQTTTRTFELSKSLSLIVTNEINGIRCDTWILLERHSDQAGDGRRKILCFVGTATSQTRALSALRKYSWGVYRRDIWSLDLPF